MPATDLEFARRSFLALSAAFAATGAARASSAPREGPSKPRGSTLSFEEFLALANPLTADLVGDASQVGQDRYLLALAALVVRLDDVPVPALRENSRGKKPATFIGANDGGETFTVLHWRLEPGAVIRPHAHTYGNVVTLVLEGDVRITNYEQVGTRDYDTKDPIRVRRTCDQFVERGGTNLVSLERNYVHGFVGGASGARGLDVTTRLLSKRASPVLVVEPEPVDAAAGIHSARWTSG
jgi:predicted metal-dependent enzyme (double-stranded beta helix superfamily)